SVTMMRRGVPVVAVNSTVTPTIGRPSRSMTTTRISPGVGHTIGEPGDMPIISRANTATLATMMLPPPNGQRISGERRAEGDERVRCLRVLGGGTRWSLCHRQLDEKLVNSCR